MKKSRTIFCTISLVFEVAGVANADLNDGLVAHYPFSGNAKDVSGNGLHATLHGSGRTTTALMGLGIKSKYIYI